MNLYLKSKYAFILISTLVFQFFFLTVLSAQESALSKHFEIKKYIIPADVLSDFRHNCLIPKPKEPTNNIFGGENSVINNIHAQRPVLITSDSEGIYLMLQERPPQGVCADIKKGYAFASLADDTVRTIKPLTYEEMDIISMSQGKFKGDLLAVTRVSQRLLNALIEFNASEEISKDYKVTVPFGRSFPYRMLPIDASYVLPNGNYVILAKNRDTEYWELFFFSPYTEDIEVYEKKEDSEEQILLRPKNPNPEKWEELSDEYTIKEFLKHNEIYPFGTIDNESFDEFLGSGGYKHFSNTSKRIPIHDYPTVGLRSPRWETTITGLDSGLKDEYQDIKALLAESPDETEISALKLEEIELRKLMFWASINNTSSGIHLAKDSKGNVYVHSSISPITVVYYPNGDLKTYIYDTTDMKLSCLLADNPDYTCDSKKEFNALKKQLSLMMDDYKTVNSAETQKAFESKWEIYDGLAVNQSGKVARTRKTKSGRVLEIFSPDGNLLIKDLLISDLALLNNNGDLSENFYFVKLIDSEPDNHSNQPSYEILELKLRIDYSMQR